METLRDLIRGLENSGFKATPTEICGFVESDIEPRFSGLHQDYIEFIKSVYDFYVGDSDADRSLEEYVYLTFFPVEDMYDLSDPFKDDFFCIAESEDNFGGSIQNVSYYLSLGNKKVGVYYSTYDQSEEATLYNYLCDSFSTFIKLIVSRQGKVLGSR